MGLTYGVAPMVDRTRCPDEIAQWDVWPTPRLLETIYVQWLLPPGNWKERYAELRREAQQPEKKDPLL